MNGYVVEKPLTRFLAGLVYRPSLLILFRPDALHLGIEFIRPSFEVLGRKSLAQLGKFKLLERQFLFDRFILVRERGGARFDFLRNT